MGKSRKRQVTLKTKRPTLMPKGMEDYKHISSIIKRNTKTKRNRNKY